MKIYKVHINDRNYTSWTFYNTVDFLPLELQIRPDEHKLFSNDVFSVDEETNSIAILHSSIRTCSSIPGVIILKNNKTYGRAQNGKLLYKCIPDDKRLPAFLIPYEMKNIGFSKVFKYLHKIFEYRR